MPVLETGFVFPLTIELLCRGSTEEEILEKLKIKKKEVSIHTLRRFHKRYAKEVDPIRKIGEAIKQGTLKPTDLLSTTISSVSGEFEIVKAEDFKEPNMGYWDFNYLMNAKANATVSGTMPKTVREIVEKERSGEMQDLTRDYGRGAKSEKFDYLTWKMNQTGTRRK